MKHLFRFQAERLESGWQMDAEEWHHAIKVLRLTDGTSVELGDGLGWSASAVLRNMSKSRGELEITSEAFAEARPETRHLTLALGVLKPQSIDDILPGLVELGIHRLILVPFHGMDRSRLSDKLKDRWQRLIVSACKQAKAPWAPELVFAASFQAFVDSSAAYPKKLLLHPEGGGLATGTVTGPVLAAIGSEGGWSDHEVESMRSAGFEPWGLKTHILRATTASLAAAAILGQALEG